jgi:hypothetical protein
MRTTRIELEGANGKATILAWQDDDKVKCTTCGMRYRPPVK